MSEEKSAIRESLDHLHAVIAAESIRINALIRVEFNNVDHALRIVVTPNDFPCDGFGVVGIDAADVWAGVESILARLRETN